MGGTIVCGVSGSPAGRSPAGLASALGARLGLRLVLVSVVDVAALDTDGSPSARRQRNGAEEALRDIAGEIGSDPETRIVHGRPAEALAQVAAEEGADLIVVGSRPAGIGGGKLRSTLARELEAMTPVPVLVSPPATRSRSKQRLTVAAGAS
jgi:nucleotide-binding universal stress UspA family protein